MLAVDVALPPSSYYGRRGSDYASSMAPSLASSALPGVSAAAITSRLPLRGEAVVNTLSYPNDMRPGSARPLANYRYVSRTTLRRSAHHSSAAVPSATRIAGGKS